MKADENLNKNGNISYTGLFYSLAITLFKLFAGFFGNSTVLLADAVRSLSELIKEILKILDISIANKPGDWNHNYGHGKILTLFMGAGACVLLLAGIQSMSLASGELLRFIDGRETKAPEIFALLVAVSILVSKEIIPLFGRKSGKDIESNSVEANVYVRNSRIENLILSSFIALGIGCTFLPGKNWDIADPFIAVLISLYLLGTSGKLLYGTANELIEASLDEKDNREIREIITRTEGVLGSSELKTRKIGNGIAINACITVNGSLNIQEVAEIADQVEKRLKTVYGQEIYTLIKAEPDPERNCSFQKKIGTSEDGRKKAPV